MFFCLMAKNKDLKTDKAVNPFLMKLNYCGFVKEVKELHIFIASSDEQQGAKTPHSFSSLSKMLLN